MAAYKEESDSEDAVDHTDIISDSNTNIPSEYDIISTFNIDYNTDNYDRSRNLRLFPSPPLIATQEECIVGIDEAGRGPVLGPMVYGICYCPVSKMTEFDTLGFADSKQLKKTEREKLFEVMTTTSSDFIGRGVVILSPNYISNCMLSREKINLNIISHDTAISMIETLCQLGVKIKQVILDTVGRPNTYQQKLNEYFQGKFIIEVHIKADSRFSIVSGASICAKVTRDWCITHWRYPEKLLRSPTLTLGSGYTSDPVTKQWLNADLDKVFGYPNIVRFGWSTCSRILEKQAYPVFWEGDENVDTMGMTELHKLFGQKSVNIHHFFSARSLSTPVNFD